MKPMPEQVTPGRDGERGAALVTALLVAMLLLAAGGALIASTGMAASNAVDSTAEVQAYYAADAGLQAALNVIRRNRPASDGATAATFHNIACGAAGPCTNTGNNMSLWLVYDPATGLVKLSESPLIGYAVTVRDPSKGSTATLAADYLPRYLLVRSVGRGPKGATKVLEMMVDRLKFEYDAPAPLVFRESEDGTNHLTLDMGSGNPTYSGKDKNSVIIKGAVGVGTTFYNSQTDYDIASAQLAGFDPSKKVGGLLKMGSGAGEQPWPAVVANADNARSFVQTAKKEAQRAMLEGHGYRGTCPANNFPLNGLIFIQGNCSLGSGNNGAGFMIVTGNLTLNGSYNFEGLIFVLGSGNITRSGSGGTTNGQLYGGILAANFGASGGFGAVNFNSNGAGTSIIQYDSVAIENALTQFGPRTLGIVEK